MYQKLQIVVLLVFIFSCKAKNNKKVFLQSSSSPKTSFKEIFKHGKDINLEYPEDAKFKKIERISSILVSEDGKFFVEDPFGKQILVFDHNGNYIKKIGGEGKGPGEFVGLKSVKFDKSNNLWVYDSALSRFSIFKAPNYSFTKTIKTENRFADFIISDGNIIAYTPTDEELIKKYSLKGNLKSTVHEFNKRALRVFLGRFKINGLLEGFKEGNFFMIYPGEFAINLYSENLKLMKTLRSKSESEFRPTPPKFPSHLDPYGYNKQHEKYWISFLHIYKLFKLNKERLALQLYKQTKNKTYEFYVNLYSLKGEVLAEGISIPRDGVIVGSDSNKIYVSFPQKMKEDGTIRPMKLISYELQF